MRSLVAADTPFRDAWASASESSAPEPAIPSSTSVDGRFGKPIGARSAGVSNCLKPCSKLRLSGRGGWSFREVLRNRLAPELLDTERERERAPC